MHLGVDLLDKLDGLQVLVSAVLVRQPLSVISSVIEVQHGSHGIHADPVDVIFIRPVKSV